MPEDLGERTEEATPKRLQDAREEGNVAKSQDFAASLLLLGVTILLMLSMMPTLTRFGTYLEQSLRGELTGDMLSIAALRESSVSAIWIAARIGAPLLLGAWILAFLSHFAQVGWLFSPKAIQPRLSKLNPIAGFQRIFGLSGVMRALMDSSKVTLVLVVVVLTIISMFDVIVLLPNLTMMQGAGKTGHLLVELALKVAAVLLALGLLDFMYQRWKHRRDLRMSKTEVREEFKQTEGDPETRKRRYRMQQQIAMQRLHAHVPKADVVVTNPEHISVALQYVAGSMNAPKVVAKGQDYIAIRIRHIAMMHGIPIIERKPLARALYYNVRIGQEVPPQFYQAVAEVLAYVYRLSGRKAG